YFGFENNIINFENTSQNATLFSWSFGNEISTEENPTYDFSNVEENSIVNLKATNQFGCFDSTSTILQYKSLQTFYIPNSFTPDGNKFNNTFSPVFSSDFKVFSYRFRIFDKWGELVFETRDYQSSWDGTFHEKIIQDGIYGWEIVFQDDNFKLNKFIGHVSLIK
ncbi:MAG: gliding motility-associated C-terminal domain-containing protein, partial [Bacteroidota bacterium]